MGVLFVEFYLTKIIQYSYVYNNQLWKKVARLQPSRVTYVRHNSWLRTDFRIKLKFYTVPYSMRRLVCRTITVPIQGVGVGLKSRQHFLLQTII